MVPFLERYPAGNLIVPQQIQEFQQGALWIGDRWQVMLQPVDNDIEITGCTRCTTEVAEPPHESAMLFARQKWLQQAEGG
jgi:hypothetical protein